MRATKFVQGAPCRHGHSGLSYQASGECVECTKLRAKDYRQSMDLPPRPEAEIRRDLADQLTAILTLWDRRLKG